MMDRLLAIEETTFRSWVRQAKEHRIDFESIHTPEAEARLQPGRRNIGSVAVVSLSGFISQKLSLWALLFGGTSTEALIADLRQLAADDTIGSIVLNVDSPGGSVFGLAEAASAIRALRGSKPIVSVANSIMASAAYYLAAQADEVVATPSALVGSIGTIAEVVDDTEFWASRGIKFEVFTYGARKDEGMPPLDDEDRSAIQAEVDYYGGMFEADVAKGRGISRADVRKRYGQGHLFNARPALDAGLVDRIATLDQVVADLASGRAPASRAQAAESRLQQASWALRLGLSHFQRER